MNGVNKTLYIPLYGKASVSKKGIIIQDKKAEMIWEKEGFELKGKAKSKWLTYYMGMRSAVFDTWVKEKLRQLPSACVLHIGCGMDSRIERIGAIQNMWYDIDFPAVIEERKKYYQETKNYVMLGADASKTEWIEALPSDKKAMIVMEGISMYIAFPELTNLLSALNQHFREVKILMDCYTVFAAKASKYKNPINEVGVSVTYGYDEPLKLAEAAGISFVGEHTMTPEDKVLELQGFERLFFKKMMTGKIAEKLYRLYEFQGKSEGDYL